MKKLLITFFIGLCAFAYIRGLISGAQNDRETQILLEILAGAIYGISFFLAYYYGITEKIVE